MSDINRESGRKEQQEVTSLIEKWIEQCKSNYDLKIPDNMFYSSDEFYLSVLVGLWLIRFFNGFKKIKDTTTLLIKLEMIKKRYPMANALWDLLDILFGILIESDNLEAFLSLEFPDLHYAIENDILGTILQRSLDFEDRKKLAANYTNVSSASILISMIKPLNPSSVIDPSCGSGRLITSFLNQYDSSNEFPRIRINDIMPSAVLIAYCRIILKLSDLNQDLHILEATIGDAFEIFINSNKNKTAKFRTYDLVMMNPPFTRSHRISLEQRKKLQGLEKKYQNSISGQIGLHVYSIFLADMLVSNNGTLALILPAATILSSYSKGVHDLLLSNYRIEVIASSISDKSYSENSNLREIFIIAKRRKTASENETVKFLNITELNMRSQYQISSSQVISVKKLEKEWNWTLYLQDPKLLEIRDIIRKSGLIKNGKSLKMDIVRGVEMYGPDFFFIPNHVWKIIDEDQNNVVIKSHKTIIEIPKKFLVRSLRKPSKYIHYISPNVSDFALSIPDAYVMSQKWLEEYFGVTERYAVAAKRKFGSRWVSHIYQQISAKQPWGYLFFIDKFSISTTGVLGHYFENKISCSKNFYLLRNYDSIQAKLLAAWLNSTFFIILFLCIRREIGGSYGRLQIIDYMREPLFLDFSTCSQNVKDLIFKEFDKLRTSKLQSIPIQIRSRRKRDLDLAIAHGLQIHPEVAKVLLEDMYILLDKLFTDLHKRDKS
ncbi:MAG: Eco57I restriction-modification methylase domain-containing protein [Candidatus Hodarchaeota archaeon]